MRLTNLATIARRTGFPVTEVAGWRGRGRAMSGVKTIVCHHTAGPKTGEIPSLNVLVNGRPGLPGPLCHYGIGRSGRIYVVADGRANHAGVVRDWTYGNDWAIGIEAEEDGVSGWAQVQMRSYAALCWQLIREFDLSLSRVLGHKDVCSPPGRKSDPNFSMSDFRDRVRAAGSTTDGGDDMGEFRVYTIKPVTVAAGQRATLMVVLDKDRESYALGVDINFDITVELDTTGSGHLVVYQWDPDAEEIYHDYKPVRIDPIDGLTHARNGIVTHGRHLRLAVQAGDLPLVVSGGRVDMHFS